RGTGGRRGGDGHGVFGRAEEPIGSERGHRPRECRADRPLRGAGARAAQLRARTDADEPAILARCSGHVLIATMTASLVTNSGRSAWFVGVLVLMVYLIFAMTLYLLPPRTH